jgi:hypothetical protein
MTIIAVVVPFSLEAGPPPSVPSSKYPISFLAKYTESIPQTAGLKRALEQGHVVDLDVQCDITENNTQWELFEDMLTKSILDLPKTTPIVLCQSRTSYRQVIGLTYKIFSESPPSSSESHVAHSEADESPIVSGLSVSYRCSVLIP